MWGRQKGVTVSRRGGASWGTTRSDAGGREGWSVVKTADAVVVQDLGKSFRRRDGETVAALDGVTLSASTGAHTAVTGQSGAGKTTPLQWLTGPEKTDDDTGRSPAPEVPPMWRDRHSAGEETRVADWARSCG